MNAVLIGSYLQGPTELKRCHSLLTNQTTCTKS